MYNDDRIRKPKNNTPPQKKKKYTHLVLVEILKFFFQKQKFCVLFIQAGIVAVTGGAGHPLHGPDLASTNWSSGIC